MGVFASKILEYISDIKQTQKKHNFKDSSYNVLL